jgi:hypothetical protein
MMPPTSATNEFLIAFRSLRFWILATFGTLWLAGSAMAVTGLPTNNDPNNQIRFKTAAGADGRRRQLVDYVWSDGFPTSVMPAAATGIAYPSLDLTGLNRSLISSVDRLDANVSGMDFHSISYLLHPTNTAHADRVVIAHQGHVYSPETSMAAGVGNAVNRLLQDGYSVVAMNMPLCGWNTDNTIKVPGGSTATISNAGSTGHHDMFNLLAPSLGGVLPPALGDGAVFRFFLEPVVQTINYLRSTTPNLKDISLIGLSGGGWTTSMAAGIDPRIQLSVACSGSAPLYAWNAGNWYADGGDAIGEQTYPAMYDENVKPDGSGGGVATWQECYTLGGYGDGRRQIMVTIPGDQYFNDHFADGFKDVVANLVKNDLKKGQWSLVYDDSTNIHSISDWTIGNVIMPALETPEPSSRALSATAMIGVAVFVWFGRRSGRA